MNHSHYTHIFDNAVLHKTNLRLFLAILFLVSSFSLSAESSLLLQPDINKYTLTQYFETQVEPKTLSQLQDPDLSQHSLENQQHNSSLFIDAKPHWLKLRLLNTGVEIKQWYLQYSLTDNQQVEVFRLLNNGRLQKMNAIEMQPYAFGKLVSRSQIYELTVLPDVEQVFAFKLINVSPGKFDAELRTRSDIFSELNARMLWLGVLLGMLLVFLAYHAYLYYMIRRQHNRWMLLFVLSLVSIVFYYGALVMNSRIASLGTSSSREALYILSMFIIISAMLFHQYARSFIVISQNMWQLEKIHMVLLISGLLMLLFLLFNNSPGAGLWVVLYVFSVVLFAQVRVYFSSDMDRRTSNYFTIGASVFLISVILNQLAEFPWFPVSGMDDDVLKFGAFILIVCHSLAIAEKSGYLKREAVNINQSLVQSDARYRAFITNSTQGIFRFELEKPMPVTLALDQQVEWILNYSIVAECNDRWANSYGYGTSSTINGLRLSQLWQADSNIAINLLADFIKSEYRLLNYDAEEILSSGMHKWFHNSVSGEVSNGFLVRIWGTQIDITERKKAEAAIRKVAAGVSDLTGDAFFIQLVSNLYGIFSCRHILIGLMDEVTKSTVTAIAYCVNGKIKENITYNLLHTPCALVVNNESCIYPEHVQKIFPDDEMLVEMDAESYIGTPLYDARGEIIGLIIMLDDKPMQNVEYMLEVLKIFSVRASAELDRLYATKIVRKLSLVVEQSPNAILITNVEGNIEYINSAFIRITGYEPEQIIGRSHSIIKSDKTADSVYDEIWQTVTNGGSWAGEIYNVKKNGEYYWDWLTVSPITDESGNITHYLHILNDITEHKENQKIQNELQQQLVQAQKMEALGQLTGGVAHDFNNILTSIMGYSSLALDISKQQGQAKVTNYLETVIHSGNRARDLVTQMLAFSRREGAVEKRVIDLELLMLESIKMLMPMLTSSIDIAYHIEGDVKMIEADPVKIHQVIMNLCVNARDAMQDQGKINLSLEYKFEKGICASCHSPVEGEFIELAVMDTGSGISPESIARVFEPFFTTKDVGKGTGMGLAMVHGIMHEHNGHIIVNTKPDVGSEFRLLFPVTTNRISTVDTSVDNIEDSTGHGQQVLVVDDEQAINSFLKELLEVRGYRVTCFTNPLDALDEISAQPGKYDLVITDQTMPELTGLDFIEAILAIRENMPVILCTGNIQSLDKSATGALEINKLLKKPYTTKELLDAIHNCLN